MLISMQSVMRLCVPLMALFMLQACASENRAPVIDKQAGFHAPLMKPAQKPRPQQMFAGYYNKAPIQCVPYAREVSGFNIYGDAHTWWQQAPRKGYSRGQTPQEGAVLVLKKGRKLDYGHVAVVKNVISPREIEVAHSNWGDTRKTRRFIYEAMRVRDVSPQNDWSSVKFWNKYIDNFGLPYPNHGFIYPSTQMAAAAGKNDL